jgi:CheY-like chemotaxis protein
MAKARIVVVEDERDLRDLVVEELQDLGYEIAVAANGMEGLEVISSFRPNLILSDITMPVMDGHMMLKALRDRYPGMRSAPVVFLSALADRSHIIEGKRLGVDDYVTKPIDFELLAVTIETRLREVQRITVQNEEQMLKLYTSLMQLPKERRQADPALLVCDQWSDVSAIRDCLEGIPLPVVTLNRGSQLDAYLKDKSYSLIVMTPQSDDHSAKLAVMNSKLFKDFAAPKFLFFEERGLPPDADLRACFTKVEPIKTARQVLSGAKLVPA